MAPLQPGCSSQETLSGAGEAAPASVFPIERAGELDLVEIEARLSGVGGETFQVEGVERDGDVLRVNVLFPSTSPDEEVLRRRTLEALERILPLVGTRVPVSVWSAEWTAPNRRGFRAMAYHSPFTENRHFKLLETDE